MGELLRIIAPVAALAVGAALGLYFARRITPAIQRRHAAMRRYQGWLAAFFIPLGAFSAYTQWSRGDTTAAIVTGGGFGLVGVLNCIAVLRQPKERDFRGDFAHDPTRCGRCGYDLHGSESTTCPECGWTIPLSLTRLERRDWAMWWKGWRIGHLDDWRRTLRDTALIWLMFCTLPVVLYDTGGGWHPVMVLAGAMIVHFAVNLVRIVQYGRREAARGS